jgi:hypothetical protein
MLILSDLRARGLLCYLTLALPLRSILSIKVGDGGTHILGCSLNIDANEESKSRTQSRFRRVYGMPSRAVTALA